MFLCFWAVYLRLKDDVSEALNQSENSTAIQLKLSRIRIIQEDKVTAVP